MKTAEPTTITTERREAHDEEECLLCVPAGHPNCERYTDVAILDREKVPLGEDESDHLVDIPVCIAHYQTLEQYQQGRNVDEVSV